MNDPHQDPAEGGEAPDVNFKLGGQGGAPAAQPQSPSVPADSAASAIADDPAATDEPAPPTSEESVDTDVLSLVEGRATELAHNIARELALAGPEGWRRLE